eukprot:SAG31_NODE_192_length_20788_cov_8.938083_8_plen_73_part_00
MEARAAGYANVDVNLSDGHSRLAVRSLDLASDIGQGAGAGAAAGAAAARNGAEWQRTFEVTRRALRHENCFS